MRARGENLEYDEHDMRDPNKVDDVQFDFT